MKQYYIQQEEHEQEVANSKQKQRKPMCVKQRFGKMTLTEVVN